MQEEVNLYHLFKSCEMFSVFSQASWLNRITAVQQIGFYLLIRLVICGTLGIITQTKLGNFELLCRCTEHRASEFGSFKLVITIDIRQFTA